MKFEILLPLIIGTVLTLPGFILCVIGVFGKRVTEDQVTAAGVLAMAAVFAFFITITIAAVEAST